MIKVGILFTLCILFGCSKDENESILNSQSNEIKEIVFCQPDLNNQDLQPKFGIKTKNEILIIYEYSGAKKDSSACLFYFDETEEQGCYFIFFQNRMFQFMTSFQNGISNYVFEAEITDSIVYFREYEYDWNNDKVTCSEEYYFENSYGYTQLRSDDVFIFAMDGINDILNKVKKMYKSWGKADKKNEKNINNAIKGIDNAQKEILNTQRNDPDILNKPGSKIKDNGIKIIICSHPDGFWAYVKENWLTKVGRLLGDLLEKGFFTVRDVGAKILDKYKPWVFYNGLRIATRNVGFPGTFVANPEDFGENYQWNRGTPGALASNDYFNLGYGNAASWVPANNPCPTGYRVPTVSELRKIVDATMDKKIILPASGSFFGKPAWNYWSSQSYSGDIRYAYKLSESNNVDPLINFYNKSQTALIRFVCED